MKLLKGRLLIILTASFLMQTACTKPTPKPKAPVVKKQPENLLVKEKTKKAVTKKVKTKDPIIKAKTKETAAKKIAVKKESKNSIPLLENTKWHYVDSDAEYDIEFLPKGILKHENHPNDQDPSNESWEQKGKIIRIYFNNKFATYDGVLSGPFIMHGMAKNTQGTKWQWKAVRVKK